MIDRELHHARALLVESDPLLRSAGAGQLRELGVGHVAQAGRVKDARLMLERERFDIVVCSRAFEGSDRSGQDLLDELRRERLLLRSTVCLVLTSEADFVQAMEAAEAPLDGVLVRPFDTATLFELVMQAREHQRQLGDVLRALDAGETEAALACALHRFEHHLPHAGYCGRLAAELLLNLQRASEAGRLFERLAEAHRGAAWARLGLARSLVAKGDNGGARRALGSLLRDAPASADAHDLLGRVLVEQCDFDGALDAYRIAAELTPGSLLRAQHAGALAFYQGQADESMRWLERSLGMGVQSKLFDALSLLLIAMLRFDRGDAPGVAAMGEQLRQFRERFPDSRRLRRFENTAVALQALALGRSDTALSCLRELTGHAGGDDFDLEAANMLLALWARVPETLRPAGEHAAVVERLALRFCVSKSMGEVLAAAARRREPALGLVRRAQAQLLALTERAMDLSLQGEPAQAARQLLAAGEHTLNAKLLEMASLIARRHEAGIPDAPALCDRAATLLRRSCQAVNHIAGIQRSGRSPGGLQVRGPRAQEVAHATA